MDTLHVYIEISPLGKVLSTEYTLVVLFVERGAIEEREKMPLLLAENRSSNTAATTNLATYSTPFPTLTEIHTTKDFLMEAVAPNKRLLFPHLLSLVDTPHVHVEVAPLGKVLATEHALVVLQVRGEGNKKRREKRPLRITQTFYELKEEQ